MIPGQRQAKHGSGGYTPAEVARHLGVSANHVRAMIQQDKIRALDAGTRRAEYRISESELQRLLAAQGPGRVLRKLQG